MGTDDVIVRVTRSEDFRNSFCSWFASRICENLWMVTVLPSQVIWTVLRRTSEFGFFFFILYTFDIRLIFKYRIVFVHNRSFVSHLSLLKFAWCYFKICGCLSEGFHKWSIEQVVSSRNISGFYSGTICFTSEWEHKLLWQGYLMGFCEHLKANRTTVPQIKPHRLP